MNLGAGFGNCWQRKGDGRTQGSENSPPGACSPDHSQIILCIDVNQESPHAPRGEPERGTSFRDLRAPSWITLFPFVSGTRTDGPPSTTTGAKMLLHFCPVGVTLSWEEAHPGARASRPHKSSRSFGHLLHRNRPAAAPCLCFGRAHAVPAGRAVGCNIAGKLSGNRRDSMRAGRPRSRVGVVPMVRWGVSGGRLL